MNQWYYAKSGTQMGPTSLEELKRLLQSGDLKPNDLVWTESMPNWAAASTVPALQDVPPGISLDKGGSPAAGSYGQSSSPYGQQSHSPYAAPASNPMANPYAQPQSSPYDTGGQADYRIPVVARTAAWPVFTSFLLMLGSVLWIGFTLAKMGLLDDLNKPVIDKADIVFGADFYVAIVILIFAGIWSLVAMGIVIYRAWQLLQPGHASMTPGAATALGLIPCVNIVGNFFAFWKWTTEWNRITREYRTLAGAPTQKEGLALTFCIATIASLVCSFASIVQLITCLMVICDMVKGINWMADRREGIR